MHAGRAETLWSRLCMLMWREKGPMVLRLVFVRACCPQQRTRTAADVLQPRPPWSPTDAGGSTLDCMHGFKRGVDVPKQMWGCHNSAQSR